MGFPAANIFGKKWDPQLLTFLEIFGNFSLGEVGTLSSCQHFCKFLEGSFPAANFFVNFWKALEITGKRKRSFQLL